MKLFRVAVVGGRGLVGLKLIEILIKEKFPFSELVVYGNIEEQFEVEGYKFVSKILRKETVEKFDFVFFCVGEEVSKKYAYDFIALGAKVIDNSSYYRLDKDVPLVIPEINGFDLLNNNHLYANPNCTTIMILLGLKPLIDRYKLEKLYISSYQSTSGGGKDALNEYYLEKENPNYIPKILPNKKIKK